MNGQEIVLLQMQKGKNVVILLNKLCSYEYTVSANT